jgi:uncharacterized protein (TIGR02594 family)
MFMKFITFLKSIFVSVPTQANPEVKPDIKPQIGYSQMQVAYRVSRTQIGQKEIPGNQDNHKIVEYHQACTLQASEDETAWCSSFVNWSYIIAGILLNPGKMYSLLKNTKYEDQDITTFFESARKANKTLKITAESLIVQKAFSGMAVRLPTRDAMARSWIQFAKKVKDPQQGDVVVFERGNNGVSGHVGFIEKIGMTYILVIGGNQSNQVCEQEYARTRVLAYVRDV